MPFRRTMLHVWETLIDITTGEKLEVAAIRRRLS